MNMRKNEYIKGQKSKKRRLRPAEVVLSLGLPPILLCLFGILYQIEIGAPLTRAAANYFGGMLEYPVAALMLVTAGALIADLAWRHNT